MGKAILILPTVLCFAASACAWAPEESTAVSADGMLTFGRYEQNNLRTTVRSWPTANEPWTVGGR